MTANAGVLKHWDSYANPEHFFDWKYAQTVWFDLNTAERYDAEWAKYEGDFKPWLALYKADKRKALADLKTYPEAKRRNIERGYDMQLAFDHWFDQVYGPWYNRFRGNVLDAAFYKKYGKPPAGTFDDYLADWATFKPCVPARFLSQCGPIPDWRSEKAKAKEQAMMRAALDEAQQREQNRKK